MSKRKSLGTPNTTLFKYFTKSPASNKIGQDEKDSNDSPGGKLSVKAKLLDSPIPGSSISEKPVNNRLKRELSPDENDESIIKSKTKRKRILEHDSDSDNDVQTDNNNVLQITANCNSRNESFVEKLQQIKNEPKSSRIEVLDCSTTISSLDEQIIWPHNKLDFLKPENIKDKKGKRPSDPEYDPGTLYVPEKHLNTLSPGARQWWILKSESFDCVLFFKVGKFYELYHMDADVGVNELGFTYMRGEFAHSGFPEVSYDKMATILIDRGYKVARVEQTETPDMMTDRCKKLGKVTKYDKVVRREICQISNKGTQVFGPQCQVTYNYRPNYMISIAEKNEGAFSIYGVCFVDTSIGDFYIGQFEDDKSCSRLLTLLSHYPPVLVITERNCSTQRTQQIIRTILSNVIKESLLPGTQFWNGDKILKYLAENYFSKNDGKDWPEDIKKMQNANDHLGVTPNEDYKLGLKALGGCVYYLKKCFLDQKVLNMARYHLYIPPDSFANNPLEVLKNKMNLLQTKRKHMILDSITLANLRINGEECSLLSTLDQCCTKFGKRLLHHWLCAPSCEIDVIQERQHAISELLVNVDILQSLRALFNGLPDFERHLAQINLFGNKSVATDHPDGRAIFFEEKIYNTKKIQNFVAVLKGFESLVAIPEICESFKSDLLKHLTQFAPTGKYPDLKDDINFFKNAFDHEEAQKQGVIAPESGVDPEYDSIEDDIRELNVEIKDYLVTQEKYFGCRVTYFGTDKKRFQLEIPEKNARKAGKEYSLEGQRKGVRRFHTEQTKDFLKQMMQAEEQRNNVLNDLSRRMFEKFSNNYTLWKSCVDAIATLDVLVALAEYARNQNETCVPEIVEGVDMPFIEIEEGFHPCINAENYIPNGIQLGGRGQQPLAILTGPNMGGKSTLMRQVGLLTVMAQIGCHVPARMCKFSIVDRIFTRLGAQDDILAGHSTFLVELNETSLILKHATKNSLVLLDELGRGTATYDGTAIAASVVHFLADLKCRTLFSTHYHNLVDYFYNDARIQLGHMSCMVENEDSQDPTQETVTFLYKYTSGACPKSYGFNAAKLAGMPRGIINRAYELSKQVEAVALKRKIISKIIRKENTLQIKNLLVMLGHCKI